MATAQALPSAEKMEETTFIDANGVVVREKECSHCHYVKPLSFFYNKARGKYGRQEWCRRCMAHKPPLSAEEEIALAREKTMKTTTTTKSAVVTEVSGAAAATLDGAETVTEAQVIDTAVAAQEATQEVPQTNGRVTFSEWLRITGSELFATPEFAIMRVPGSSSFSIHLSANVSERVRMLANYIPAGAIPQNVIELITRLITDTLVADRDILGYAYY